MGKKNKKISKINNEIKHFFGEDPFDVGIARVDTQTLSQLLSALGIYGVQQDGDSLLKAVRTLWSEPDIHLRRDILTFFQNNEKLYLGNKIKQPDVTKEQKIEQLAKTLEATQEETTMLIDAFLQTKTDKITLQKIEKKLLYIRFEAKKHEIEKLLEGVFDIDDSFEFNASFEYKIYEHHFYKILTLNTKPYSYEYLQNTPLNDISNQIQTDKDKAIKQKQNLINNFLKSIKDPHPHLTHQQILKALRSSPPKTNLEYPSLKDDVLQNIVSKVIDIVALESYNDGVLIKLNQHFTPPFAQNNFRYILDLHIDLNSLLQEIWDGDPLVFESVIKEVKQETESEFLEELQEIMHQCKEYSGILELTDEQTYNKIYEFLPSILPKALHLSSKLKRKILRTFVYNIQSDLAKKQRQQLLARTIREFKNLFPTARQNKRKLILHIGPTNSGKTYQAMKKLKEADTGYYLAPLRLLALEGYEDLKNSGIDASLITGEEQLLNEDATHISSTIEMLNFEVDVDRCVIDEVQMIDDADRGWAWANAIIGVPAAEVIMTGSPNSKEAIIALAEYLQEDLEIIEFERKNPLTLLKHHTPIKNVKKGSAVVAFSRKDVLKLKQTFSKYFNVSVVYGNLSPEVRREEARRFREKQTDILIATDAIAMGMNLPIQTILFYKADKFDGISQRELLPSEIHQISGRAGRFGLSEEGFVGALSEDILKTITKNFNKEDKKITLPFRVMANLEHIKLVGKILEENSLEEILKFFVKNMEFKGPFRATNLDDMLEVASIVDSYDLDISTKYHLACAPLTLKSPYILSSYERYIEALQKKEIVKYKASMPKSKFAQSSKELLMAEDMVKEISLYLWLSYRFEDYFLDTQKARQHRVVLNRYIEESLTKKFVQTTPRYKKRYSNRYKKNSNI